MASLALVWDLIARDAASPAFNRVAVSADRAAAATGKAETGVLSFGKKAVAALGAIATIDIAAHMVSEAAKFQKAMLTIQTQAGASASEVKSMSKAVLALAGPVATSPLKLADSLYHIESTGLRGAKALEVLKIAAEGAKIGNADLTETTNALTSAVVSGIPGVKNIGQAMGALNAIVGAGDMKLSDLNDALGTGILTKAKSYGLSLTDVGAALATFGDLNIRGADAAMQLRMAFEAFAKPAAGGLDVLRKLGLSATTLRDDMQKGGLNKAVLDLNAHLKAAGITGNKVGGELLDAFSKKGASGVTLLINNLAQFESKYPAIIHGAQNIGLAWKATQGTASFAFSRIVAEVEAAGIAIGDKLLPAVTTAATWLGTNLPHAVSTLSAILGPTVQIIGSALVGAFHAAVAILGPLMSGLGGIGDFLASDAPLATALATTVLAIWAAFKGYTLAVAAFKAIDTAIILTRVRLLELGGIRGLMSSLAGSITPVGAAVAGIGVIIGAATYEWQRQKQVASATAAAIQSDVNSLTDAIKEDSGALGANTRAWVENRLQQAGTYDLATKIGVSFKTMTDAALGNAAAMREVNKAQSNLGTNDQIKAFFQGGAEMKANAVETGKAQHAYSQLSKAKKEDAAATANGSTTTAANTNILQWNIDAHGRLIQTSVKAGSQVDNTTAAMQRQTFASGLLKNALDVLNGVNESVEQTQDALAISLGNLRNKSSLFKDANGNLVTSLSKSTVAGATNRTMLAGIIDQAKAAAQAVADHARQQGKSLPDALRIGNAALRQSENAIRAAAAAAHLSKGETDRLIGSLGHLAKIHVAPQIDAQHILAANRAADALQAKLNAIANGNYVVHIGGGSQSVRTKGGAVLKAAGGYVSGPGTGTSDSVPAWLSNGEFVVNAAQTGKHLGLLRAINSGVRGFAKGGAVNPNYTISGSETIYGSKNAAVNAAHRELAANLTLSLKIKDKDLADIRKVIGGTVDQARTWFKNLLTDAKKAGILSQQVLTLIPDGGWGRRKVGHESLGDLLKQQDKTLNQAIDARNKTTDRLKTLRDTMKQLASGIASAVTGFFDVTQAGANPVTGAVSGQGMEAQQRQALNQIKEFAADIKTLESRHLNSAYLMQLAGQGPSVLPQLRALLSLKSLSNINTTEEKIQSLGASVGAGVSNTVYGAQQASLVANRQAQEKQAKATAHLIAKEVRDALDGLEDHVDVKVDGKVLLTIFRKAEKAQARR